MKDDILYNGLEEMNGLIWDVNSCFGILSTISNADEINENALGQVALIAEVGIEKIHKLVSKNEELTNMVLKNKLKRIKPKPESEYTYSGLLGRRVKVDKTGD